MVAKSFLTLYACASLVMSAFSQCIGREAIIGAGPFGGPWPYDSISPFDNPYGPGWPAAGCAVGPTPYGPAPGFAPAAGYGGGLSVTSASPISPTGLTVTSENTIEGVVAVTGQLPFLGAVATDGIFPTVGAGDVWYGCGDGAIGIIAETPIAPAAVTPAYGYGGAQVAGLSYNGFAGPLGYVGSPIGYGY